MNKIDKLKYELVNKRMFDQCGLNVYALLHYNDQQLDFNLFEYICNFGDVLEYPISLISLFSMYDFSGKPRSKSDILYKNYSKIIMGNRRISYLKQYIDFLTTEQLKFYFDVYSTFWKFDYKIQDMFKIFTNQHKYNNIYHNIYMNNKHHLIYFKYINNKIQYIHI